MGWTIGYGSRRALIDTLLSEERTGSHIVVLAHCLRGNVLWSVYEFSRSYGNYSSRARLVVCDQLRLFDADRGWGYLSFDEADRPPHVTCPLGYLDLAPEASAAWRADVCAYHRRVRQPLSIGQTVRLIDEEAPQITLTNLHPLEGVFEGRRFRVRRSRLADPGDSADLG